MQSIIDKLWESHLVKPESDDTPAIIFIDLHLIHEVTSPQAFNQLRESNIKVRRPELTLATMDHSIPTLPFKTMADLEAIADEAPAKQIKQIIKNCSEFGIALKSFDSPDRGIVHIIGPELGITQPGKTIVCGDSHTSTHGAFGALAFGIGTTEVGHVLATQCMLQRKPKTFAINIEGNLQNGVTAKDIILKIIGKIGVDGGTGYAIEYRGSVIRSMSMEERMTICNMTIEAGARAGVIAPDDTTFEYLASKPLAPKDAAWDKALAYWKTLPSDEGSFFDREMTIDVTQLAPMVTYGTNPGMVIGVNENIPKGVNASADKAMLYMNVKPESSLLGEKVDVVFIGSCTNGRLSDLKSAADMIKGKKVAKHVRMLVVPGSQSIKENAESIGLDKIFKESGAEWREPGCSMCIAMNGDFVPEGGLAVSTSNRNFEGRQGLRARTILASPLTATASAIMGVVADPRIFTGE
jgi:3-isopropylmalate/(R)-2-methylmalate dehydratase large subunit